MPETLYDKALAAITELFGDTSVSRSETRENLETLKGEIETMLSALEADDLRDMEAASAADEDGEDEDDAKLC